MKIKLNSEIFSEAIFKLEGEGGIFVSDNGIAVEAVPSADSTLKIVYQSGKATVFYPTKPAFFRALTLLKEKYKDGDFEYTENKKIGSLGYMVDCSRNAVYTVETVKKMIRQIALMGYDYFMLYCEDTIEIKEYPMLGYMRSRYSHEEIKEIVAFGALYGIELV
ncbi:MAG: family 20 glycosylhydrolase, partial [Clostridia bacterium]|nr:family 20 glycosylhydrolase [Clostridia bacterium]